MKNSPKKQDDKSTNYDAVLANINTMLERLHESSQYFHTLDFTHLEKLCNDCSSTLDEAVAAIQTLTSAEQFVEQKTML